MKIIFSVALIIQLYAYTVSSQKILGCYWGSWTSISQINIKLCTHAYFAFYTTDSNGVISTTSSGVVSSFLGLKSQNPSVKMFASIGGYNAGTDSFSAIASNPTLTSRFVSNCVTLAQNYDGIDLDWEYPKPHEKAAFVNLLGALKSALNAKGKILAIAVAAGTWQISESYDIANVCRNIDLLNLMSYDLQWPYTVTGPNAGYSTVDGSVGIWINNGCPSSKVVLGLASYGYSFSLVSSSSNGVGAQAYGATPVTYRSICNKLKTSGWTTVRYDQTPYSFKGNEWISFDDQTSLTAKLNIVRNRNLPGAFFWSTEQDDYDNSCGYGSFPLITSVYNALGISTGGGSTNPPVATTTRASSVATTKPPTQGTTSSTLRCPADGFYAYPGDCTRYYRCVSGTIYEFSCGPGLGWNQALLICDFKANIPGCY